MIGDNLGVQLGFHGRNSRSHRCACGDMIIVINDTEGIAYGVRAHQRTAQHSAWAATQGFMPAARRPRIVDPVNEGTKQP